MEGDLDQYTMAALTQEAIDCLPNALTIFDESLVPLLANKVSRELYEQLHRAMASGRSYREATFLSIKAADPKLCDDEAWQLADMLEALFRSGDTVEVSHRGGRIFRTTYTPMSGNRYVAIAVDITELRQREEELMQAKQQADAANQAKSAFLANMSHEVRTPLNGILGMAQVLMQSNLTSQQREYAEIVIESGGNLKTLLDDVLDLSKIEAGRMELAPVDNEFRNVLRRQQRLWLARAEEKGIALTLTIDESVPLYLHFDAVRLGQCISNLVSNAIKFTESGEVAIKATSNKVARGAAISITIRDTGIGMSQAGAGRLFAPFMQADASISRRFGGTGLGLVITQKFAQLMGGEVTVTSIEGTGSTFTLSFVAEPASDVTAETATEVIDKAIAGRNSLHGKKLLLVDDHPLNRRVGRLFLEPEGAFIIEAENGVEALEKLAGDRFDLVLLDIHMPVLDGIQTLKRIRASLEPWHDIPIIALTADAMSGDRERYLAEGMDGYISKPIDKLDLLNEIHRLLGSETLQNVRLFDAKIASPEFLVEKIFREEDLVNLFAEMDGERLYRSTD